MRKIDGERIYSATDIVNFLECEHLTSLDLQNLENPLPTEGPDDFLELIAAHGLEHERVHLAHLKSTLARVVDLSLGDRDLDATVARTVAALREGPDATYQGALRTGNLAGHPDFLIRVDRPSKLGAYSYEVVDTKLARSPRAKFLIQLCFYSSLLADVQGALPERMHVVLGDGTRVSYRVADYFRYFEVLRKRFLERVATPAVATLPVPCSKCRECSWSDLCNERWEREDHLCRVANIRGDQARKLTAAGVATLEALATLPEADSVPRLASATLGKLRHQASLQYQARHTGERAFDVLPDEPTEGTRGFRRMPAPDPGDLYFDMEGDPLEVGGLEYLFGVGQVIEGELRFRAFWAHSRDEERRAFEEFMDHVSEHLRCNPAAHIYHYASYEETALKRLMSIHGTREREVDDLLRGARLVDLYKVVREGIRVSEPGYSIKDIERFYMPPREGEVRDAGGSIIAYERWRQTREQALLRQIEDYNRVDVQSTSLLHRWLCGIRPAELPWKQRPEAAATKSDEDESPDDQLERYRDRLLEGIPPDATDLTPEQELRSLTFQLLDFHRRAQKPEWWALFHRMDLDEEELVEDIQCLGGLERDPSQRPVKVKRSMQYTYRYPEQETKLKDGDDCTRTDTGESLGKIGLDPATRTVTFKVGPTKDAPPRRLNLGPGRPLSDEALRQRMRDFADSVVADDGKFGAVRGLLLRQPPRVQGIADGAPLLEAEESVLAGTTRVVSRLNRSHLFIQGPPGSGKTYTGARVIVELLRQGKKVGVASNSHKAINNLLDGVVEAALERGVEFRGFKKETSSPDSGYDVPPFVSSSDIEDFNPAEFGLFAGTAWAFAVVQPETFDYLFVDEAGQVALANLVVMGLTAGNIVLLGDQMQLGQPIQGVHPGHSGQSTLDYLLEGRATIPANEGVFLPLTYRLHPDVCGFISEAVYDGRLQPAPGRERQALVLSQNYHPELRPTGVRFIPIAHEGCSQKCEAEAEALREIYTSLLKQNHVDVDGKRHPIRIEDILVVSPYNMQVNLLKQVLPDGARVGTVDKFQGQEAAVVLVSMATSSGEDLPRDIEFLYSKNRLNVAISRAKCLAIVLASPKLLTVRCSTPEQMALINTLCWVRGWG